MNIKLLFLSSLLAIAASLFAQLPNQQSEVGIFEHLGDTIPLQLEFFNEKGDTVTLGDLVDKPTVFSFVYFDCPGLCSPLLEGVSEVVENSDIELGKDYQIITISFNYRDTPEKAKEKKVNFLKTHSKEHAGDWKYLTGDSTNINAILDGIGFKVKPTGLDFVHPSAIIIVSPKGKITRYLYGLNYLPFDFKMAVNEAQKGLERPSINKVLEFCFSYDPQGQRYALEVTKVAGAIIIFFALILLAVLIFKPKSKRQ